MARVRVRRTVDAPPATVWARLEDIAGHVDWMADAEAIRFTSPRRRGVGTRFECDTRVGPLRTTDVMEVTEWRRHRALGVRHTGVVTGVGRFTLRRRGRRRTLLTWDERLRFPWWAGGPIGAVAGSVVLRAVWRGNLRRLAGLVEGPPPPGRQPGRPRVLAPTRGRR